MNKLLLAKYMQLHVKKAKELHRRSSEELQEFYQQMESEYSEKNIRIQQGVCFDIWFAVDMRNERDCINALVAIILYA